MKEYKEGKQKTATMVNKRRLSPPSIYEGPLSTSPLHSIARSSSSLPRLPSSDRLSSHPCTCSISALLNHEDPRNELLFSADRSAHRTLFPAREKGTTGGGRRRGPVSNSFFWRLHFVRQREGKRRKRKKKRKERKEKTGGNCVFSSCEKSLYLDGDPFENVSPVKKIGPWPAVGFRIIGEKRNLERWKVEMGGGGWRGTSRRENRNGGRVGRFVGPILLDTTRLFDKWCRVESIEIGRNEKYSVFFEINEEEF